MPRPPVVGGFSFARMFAKPLTRLQEEVIQVNTDELEVLKNAKGKTICRVDPKLQLVEIVLRNIRSQLWFIDGVVYQHHDTSPIEHQ